MNVVADTFFGWWNRIAPRTGKAKFRTQREAAEFVRRIQNEQGGPNEKLREMYRKYEEINRAKEAARNARLNAS